MSIYGAGAAKAAPRTERQSSTVGPFLVAAGVSLVIGVSAVLTIPGTLSINGLMNLAGLSRSLTGDDEITTSGIKKLVGEFATELEFLNERVETVAKTSDAGLSQRVERLDGDLAQVKKSVDDVAINMEFLDLRVDRVARRTDSTPDADAIGLKKLVADLSAEVDHLNQRVETVAKQPDLGARLVDLDFEIEVLKAQIAALKSGRTEGGNPAWAKTVDDDLAAARNDIVGLRSTLDERTAANRKDITALAARLDKIEAIIAERGDITSSIPTAPKPVARPKRRAAPGWVVEASAEGIAVVKGRAGRFEVKEGSYLPGLGRIVSITKDGGRWAVNTARGPVPFAN